MERSLAHIETIHDIRSIEGADNIELVSILGWSLVVKKNEFKDGDKAVYIEIDSIVDKENPCFAFLDKKNYKIKTMKLGKFGVISQGIAFPLSILPDGDYNIGDDVTEILKIKKIEDETPEQRPSSNKQQKSRFLKTRFAKFFMRFKPTRKFLLWLFVPKIKKYDYPAFVVKTDEIRLQNMPWVLENYKDVPMQVSEKIDGTSTGFSLEKTRKNKFDFAVLSRNVRQADINKKSDCDKNFYWDIALKYDVENVLKKLFATFGAKNHIVLQGETIGENIQSNKYHLKGIDFYAFNLVVDGTKIDSIKAAELLVENGLKWVPILETDFRLKDTVDEMIKYATGKSTLHDTLREGIVIRDSNNSISFKCISPDYLLKWDL